MSGHSKWHNIQKTKGAADAKRAQAFTKIAREMIVAVKEGGGGDPRSNSKLAAVIAKAKAANMPNDNIKRTIDKALGAGNTENYEKIVYEGYGPQGVAIIVETMTDNRNRTAGEIRHYFDKYGGNMGAANCVSWSFDRKGVIVIDNEDEELEEDAVMMDALDAGAADFEAEGETMTVYTEEDDVASVAEALTAKGYKLLEAQVEMLPQNGYIKLTNEDDIKNLQKMLDMFEDFDDVQNVWHNWEDAECIRVPQKTSLVPRGLFSAEKPAVGSLPTAGFSVLGSMARERKAAGAQQQAGERAQHQYAADDGIDNDKGIGRPVDVEYTAKDAADAEACDGRGPEEQKHAVKRFSPDQLHHCRENAHQQGKGKGIDHKI